MFRGMCSLLFFVASLCVASSGFGATPVSLDDAIETLAALESQIKAVQYRFESQEGTKRDPGDPSLYEGTVLFDFQHRRFRFTSSSVGRWYGAPPGVTHAATRTANAFDGKTYRSWKQSRGGTTLPALSEWPIQGAVDRTIQPGLPLSEGQLWLCFPHIWAGSTETVTLSALLREQRKSKRRTEVQDLGNETWQLVFVLQGI